MKKCYVMISLLMACLLAQAATWNSAVTGTSLSCKVNEAARPLKDANGKYMTIVYLENLACEKIGQNPLSEDVQYLLDQGYRVIEVDYAGHPKAISPDINMDIIRINDALNAGSFAGASNISNYRSYVLFEGYRLMRDVAYYKDDPSVYNWPGGYVNGDSLYMDIAYPANPSRAIPTIISFSYSNSWHGNEHKRLFLGYTFAMFDDSFLQAAPAVGMAWAMADHPKYCDWGQGKPQGGANKDFGSFQTNPDAARKIKSAIRTLRAEGEQLGLSGKIGIYGFSRGSTAAALAIGDKFEADFESAGLHQGISSAVQVAALGPGVFDYTLIYDESNDGDGSLETRCPKVWGPLKDNRDRWNYQGAANLVQTKATAPVFFFYNNSDEKYYKYQLLSFKSLLESKGVECELLEDYGSGHSVPKDEVSLEKMYRFFVKHLSTEDEKPSDLKRKKFFKSSKRPFDLQVMSVQPSELTCRFHLDKAADVRLTIYDLQGHCLYEQKSKASIGENTCHLSTPALSSAVYLLALTVDAQRETKSFILQ